MAKVLISLPDDLLERIDKQATRAEETRSGFFRRIAEREIAGERTRWRQEIKQLMDELAATEPDKKVPHVDAAQLIREDRESH